MNNQQLQIKGLELEIKDLGFDFLEGFSLHCGSVADQQCNIADGSVDMILTDPPYGKDYVDTWYDLAIFADKKLKEGGFLVSYFGQTHLIQFYNILDAKLNYWWTYALLHTGRYQWQFHRHLQCGWKPIVVFYKGSGNDTLKFPDKSKSLWSTGTDVIQGSGREKGLHKWQQGLSELFPLIETFSNEGDLIADPFAGSGTTLVASLQLKRQAVGIEIDPSSVNTIKRRLNKIRVFLEGKRVVEQFL